MMREEFTPTYSELPPREIFVEATNSAENTGAARSEDADDEMMQFPTLPRVEDPKAKVFTFEGLTPVSTADDAREDVVVDSSAVDKDNGVLRDETYAECSPLTADHSHGNDENDDEDMCPDSAQIVSVSSSVREKVAAWERHVASMRSVDTYDVPFDEEPIRKTVVKSDDCEKLVTTTTSVPLNTTERIEEELSMEDISNHSNPKELVVETVHLVNLQSQSIVPDNDSAMDITTPEPKAAPPHPVPAGDFNLLDQEEEPDLQTAPSDEMESMSCMVLDVNDHLQKGATASMQMAGLESYGCPDELCTQVAKLWN